MKSRTNGKHDTKSIKFIDLFCGCGGFTLGLLRAGMRCVAAVDNDPRAVETFRHNLVEVNPRSFPAPAHILCRDLTKFEPEQLAAEIGDHHVDVIVGGPPCQGFSTARQVDGANHGDRLKEDPRRNLYTHFLRFVDYFQPKIFVMENVLGLRTAAGGVFFNQVQHEARVIGTRRGLSGYRVQSQIEDARELGVPQKRRRQLIIGVRNDLPGYFPSKLPSTNSANAGVTLGTAIGDLPRLQAGRGENYAKYDLDRRKKHLAHYGAPAKHYLLHVLDVKYTRRLLNHVARPHSQRDLRDFARLQEGESSAQAMRDRHVKFEFPYDTSSFKDRYTRQSRASACSTIVAHLSKDGLMFIHPTQRRSLTPREAARIQSFPDWFEFPAARTHSFRLIGNAVPPLVGEAVGAEIARFLTETLPELQSRPLNRQRGVAEVPRTPEAAAAVLAPFANANRHFCREISFPELRRAWRALLYLMPGLHPDTIIDHGSETEAWDGAETFFPHLRDEERRVYVRSGWPIAFSELVREVRRRYESEKFSEKDYYCVDSQLAGLMQTLEKARGH